MTLMIAVVCLTGCPPGPVCEPGASQECLCGSGVTGAQTCEADGASWGPCSCTGGDDDDDATDDDDASDDDDATDDDDTSGSVDFGDPVQCDAPVDDFDRWTEQASERGIDLVMVPLPWEPCVPMSGAVVAEDLDDDGDVDLLFANNTGFPDLFANDGEGQFQAVPVGHDVVGRFGRHVYGHAVVDLDGDRLPEVIIWAPGLVASSHNEGGLSFADFEPLWHTEGYPHACIHSVTFGDVDADGDLDLFVPRADYLEDADTVWELAPSVGSTDLLLVNDGGAFEQVAALEPADGAGIALLGQFTDRDADGVQELLVPSDRPASHLGLTAFYRQVAQYEYVDEAVELGANLYMGGMGVAINDFNADGLLDYCMSDYQPLLRCLVSMTGFDGYIDAGVALGLVTDPSAHPDFEGEVWEAWSVELLDFDNDGALDGAAAAGSPDTPGGPVRPDALWQGAWTGDGLTFTDRSDELGFNLPEEHYGLAAADFDGDGFRDIVIGSRDGPPVFWDNPCGSGAWLEIELEGPASNTQAFGARVTTRFGDGRADIQEVLGPRGLGQSPAAVHVGLGDETEASIEVWWPDGQTTVVNDAPARRRVRIRHPSL